MIIWLAMLIPIVGCFIVTFLWKTKFVWWELILPVVISFIFILIAKFTVESYRLSDVQFRGGLITEARYYEYWSKWVTKTCSKQVEDGYHYEGSGKDKRRVTDYKTVYYDCSYCEEHDPYWEVLDNQKNSWNITENRFNELKKQWSATSVFVEMNRTIDKHYSCGQDGNMYSIKWDNNIITSESSTWPTTYENKVQASKSNFNLRDIPKADVKKYSLYQYPEINAYKQQNILGLDKLTYLTPSDKFAANKMFEYFNGLNGPIRKMRVFVLIFSNKSLEVAMKQRNLWDGGNKNEVVICIDLDTSNGKINWVYPFTWSENKRIAVDLREDISNLKILDFKRLYDVVDVSTKDFKYRDFKQYDYLEIEPDAWEIWMVYIVTILITGGVLYYGYQNEFENKNNTYE